MNREKEKERELVHLIFMPGYWTAISISRTVGAVSMTNSRTSSENREDVIHFVERDLFDDPRRK
jgi:hypothetical protein